MKLTSFPTQLVSAGVSATALASASAFDNAKVLATLSSASALASASASALQLSAFVRKGMGMDLGKPRDF